MTSIYFDYAATTPLDPRVLQKMLPYFSEKFGNASSSHFFGVQAKEAIDRARQQIATVLSAESREIIFTSGATESNNLAIKSAARLYQQRGKHIVTLKTEHSSVLESCQFLEKEGFSVTYLPVEKNGRLNLEQLQNAIRHETILISISHVNNEIGVVQPLEKIAAITQEKNILLHLDAAQTIGKIRLDLKKTPADLVSLSAHKVYGPKGIGALYVRRKPRIKIATQMHGGGQEQGMRSGTLPTPHIVGMGEAFFLADAELDAEYSRIEMLKKFFLEKLTAIKKFSVNGSIENSVPHILNICLMDINQDDFLTTFPDVLVSMGSACHGTEPSHVLRALGLTREQIKHSLRFSFGKFTTQAEIARVLEYLMLPVLKTQI